MHRSIGSGAAPRVRLPYDANRTLDLDFLRVANVFFCVLLQGTFWREPQQTLVVAGGAKWSYSPRPPFRRFPGN